MLHVNVKTNINLVINKIVMKYNIYELRMLMYCRSQVNTKGITLLSLKRQQNMHVYNIAKIIGFTNVELRRHDHLKIKLCSGSKTLVEYVYLRVLSANFPAYCMLELVPLGCLTLETCGFQKVCS